MGGIYVIGPRKGPYKVGIATNFVNRRRELQTAHFEELVIHDRYTKKGADMEYFRKAEQLAHTALRDHRLRGEWFSCNRATIEQAVLEAFREIDEPKSPAAKRILETIHLWKKLRLDSALAD